MKRSRLARVVISAKCPHGERQIDIGLKHSVTPQETSVMIRSVLLACPACEYDSQAWIEPPLLSVDGPPDMG